MKNNFRKLRAEKKLVQSKLNIANNTIKLQLDKIDTLNRTLELKNLENDYLKKDYEELLHRKTKIAESKTENKNEKNSYYDLWIKETKQSNKCKKWNKFLIITIFALIATLIFI